MTLKLCVICLIVLLPLVAFGQSIHQPRQVYPRNSDRLITYLHNILDQEVQDFGIDRAEVKEFNNRRKDLIWELFRKGRVIKDDSLETFAGSVISKIAIKNGLPIVPRNILLIKSSRINAYSIGRGIYIVDIGLLARLTTEDQFAFIIAHEMGHDELGHLLKNLKRDIQNEFSTKVKTEIRQISRRNFEIDDIFELQALLYDHSKFQRQQEIQSDSFAIRMMSASGYKATESLSLLSIFEHLDKPKYPAGPDLFMPLHSAEYPFQDHWIADVISTDDTIQGAKARMFSFDSLTSHPHLEQRKERLEHYLKNTESHLYSYKKMDNRITRVAEFEFIGCSDERAMPVRTMADALAMLTVYPRNSFLTAKVGSVLVAQFEERNESNQLQRPFGFNLPPEYRSVQNFFLNISTPELGEAAFHFFKNERNFNIADQRHHYLYWKICDLTYRTSEKKKIADDFRERFGKPITSYRE